MAMKRINNQYSICRLHAGRDTGIRYDSLLYFFLSFLVEENRAVDLENHWQVDKWWIFP